jgi:nucleoside-triphosphatase THEP1
MPPSSTLSARLGKAVRWLADHVDVLGALAVAIVVSIFSVISYKSDVATIAVLVTLGLLAVVLIRDRDSRDKLRQSVEELKTTMRPPPADSLFGDSRSEQPVIQAAIRELLIVQETGNKLLTEGRQAIVDLLRRHGRVQIVLAAPTDRVSRLMALRNSTLTPRDLIDRYSSVRAQLEALRKESGESAVGLEVRYSLSPVDFTAVMSDPSAEDLAGSSRALVRLAGYRVPFEKKLDLELSRQSAPGLYSAYARQAEAYFLSASKVVLLTGAKRSGKTTLIDRVIRDVTDNRPEYRDSLFWVVSKQILGADGERDGFQFVSSVDPAGQRFATKDRKSGRYEVDEDIVREVAKWLTKAHDSGQLLAIDEIGALQLRCPQFAQAINDLVHDPGTFLIGTVSSLESAEDASPETRTLLKDLTSDYRTSLYQIDGERDRVRQSIRLEMEEALRTMAFLNGAVGC